MLRRFVGICGGLLMLAIAYHLGAERAIAQDTKPRFVAMHMVERSFGGRVLGYNVYALTENGDLYGRTMQRVDGFSDEHDGSKPMLIGNLMVETAPESKAR